MAKSTLELITRSKVIAQMVWDAAKVPDSSRFGAYKKHDNVHEADHDNARYLLLQSSVLPKEYNAEKLSPEDVYTARSLLDFVENAIGWSGRPGALSYSSTDETLSIASLLQYQDLVRQSLREVHLGDKAEAGLNNIAVQFATNHNVAQPQALVDKARTAINPTFEDGLTLADHQRMARSSATPTMQPNPSLDQLARQLAASPQSPQTGQQPTPTHRSTGYNGPT